MFAEKTALRAEDLPDDLHGLRCAIEAAIPHGRSANGGQGDVGAWEYIPMHVMAYNNISGLMVPRARLGEKFENRWTNENVLRQFGTLGGGNHFVEVSIDENGDVWIMLHSGSRGIGHALASAYIERAQASLEKYFVKLPDPDLAYLPEGTPDFDHYLEALEWAQAYAMLSRRAMMESAFRALFAYSLYAKMPTRRGETNKTEPNIESVHIHHNYTARENHFGETEQGRGKHCATCELDVLD